MKPKGVSNFDALVKERNRLRQELFDLPRKLADVETQIARLVMPDAHLSIRQRQVLVMVQTGMQDKEIAAALDISVRTVKFHVGSLLRRFQATSRKELGV